METCRICLSREVDMVPMDEKFLIKYNILTDLNLTMDNKFLNTCSICYDGATYCFAFREKCIKADQTLNEIVIHIPKKENDDDTLIKVKKESLDYVEDADDAELIDECYNYGEDYVKPQQVRKSNRKVKKMDGVSCTNLSCGICPSTLNSREELTEHLECHKTDFACALCKDSLISVPNMLGHRMKHVPSNQRLCHICSRKFISPENLEFHYMRVHEMADKDAKILCKKCLKPYSTVKKLQKHMSQHAETKYTCDHCSKKFRSRKLVQIHIIHKHIPKPTYRCDICDHACNSTKAIANHKLRKHSAERAVCKTCGRIFPSQEKLGGHDCKHRLPVICPVCGITYQAKGKRNINDHMKAHNETVFKCPQCPATFKSKGCFRSHLDRHAGTPRFRCEWCDRKFYNQPAFIKHQRTHTGEKPYVCKICSRGFTGNHNLKVHMKVHGIHNLIKKKNSSDQDSK